MNSVKPMDIMTELVTIARDAGEEILTIYEGDIDVMTKSDESPLTQADLASHTAIRHALSELTPDTPILSEEDAASFPYSTRKDWNEYWLVDPLDGTKEFINRNGEFTVNIALIRGHRAVAGIVHVPVTGKTYYGVDGRGAWIKDGEDEAVAIGTRKPPAATAVVVGSRSHANPNTDACLAGIGDYTMISMGSSLKLCLVADGTADLYPRLGPTSEWDTAAAQAVVEAAGGAVVNMDGEPLPYNAKESILNPWFLVLGDPDAGWMDKLNTDI